MPSARFGTLYIVFFCFFLVFLFSLFIEFSFVFVSCIFISLFIEFLIAPSYSALSHGVSLVVQGLDECDGRIGVWNVLPGFTEFFFPFRVSAL